MNDGEQENDDNNNDQELGDPAGRQCGPSDIDMVILMNFGVFGMVSIPGVVWCSCIATNPGSAEEQDFGSLAHCSFIVYLHHIP